MARNGHTMAIFSYKIAKNWEEREKLFYVVAFDLIKILKSWASQNDRHILSFVKDINVVVRFISDQSLKTV